MDGKHYTPDQVGERAFCVWEVTDSRLGVILDNNEQAVIIYNYPAELCLPVHKAKFSNGLLTVNDIVPAFDCSCWLKGDDLVPFQEVL